MVPLVVYIISRNYLTWPKWMADTLASQGHEPVFVDSGSTWEPLLEWFEKCPYRIERFTNKDTKWTVWRNIGDELKKHERYVVTDPDMGIADIPEDWPEVLEYGLENFDCIKSGFHLREDKVPSHNPAWWMEEIEKHPEGFHPERWESRFLKEGPKCKYYNMGVDTTFALYKKPEWGGTTPGTRSGPPYTARHLPHHIVPQRYEEDSLQIPIDDEIYHYFQNSVRGGSRQRLKVMMVEYEDEKSNSQSL